MADAKIIKLIPTTGKLKELTATDTVPTQNLGTGTADNTTYLRGDQTWQVVPTGGLSQAQVLGLTTLKLL